jgi:hypothetical protein
MSGIEGIRRPSTRTTGILRGQGWDGRGVARYPTGDELIDVVAVRAEDLLLGGDDVGLHVIFIAADVGVLGAPAYHQDLGHRGVLAFERCRGSPLYDPGAGRRAANRQVGLRQHLLQRCFRSEPAGDGGRAQLAHDVAVVE